MNAEFINAFIQGTQNTFNIITGETPELGNVFIKNNQHEFKEATVVVAISGEEKGYVLYTTSDNDGLRIVSKMMMGIRVSTWDDMGQSGLKELCNMISGNVCTRLSKLGKLLNIAPPEFVANIVPSETDYIKSDSLIFCLPLNFKDGSKFDINLLITKE